EGVGVRPSFLAPSRVVGTPGWPLPVAVTLIMLALHRRSHPGMNAALEPLDGVLRQRCLVCPTRRHEIVGLERLALGCLDGIVRYRVQRWNDSAAELRDARERVLLSAKIHRREVATA